MMKLVAIPRSPSGQYIKQVGKFHHTADGKCYLIGWEQMPLTQVGTITKTVDIPADAPSECIQDLQAGIDCFCADQYTVGGKRFIVLQGNGWADELGFPYDESMQRYPILSGQTGANIRAQAKLDQFGHWSVVFSGNMNDLYAWSDKDHVEVAATEQP